MLAFGTNRSFATPRRSGLNMSRFSDTDMSDTCCSTYWWCRAFGRTQAAIKYLEEKHVVVASAVEIESTRPDVRSQFITRVTDLLILVPGGMGGLVRVHLCVHLCSCCVCSSFWLFVCIVTC